MANKKASAFTVKSWTGAEYLPFILEGNPENYIGYVQAMFTAGLVQFGGAGTDMVIRPGTSVGTGKKLSTYGGAGGAGVAGGYNIATGGAGNPGGAGGVQGGRGNNGTGGFGAIITAYGGYSNAGGPAGMYGGAATGGGGSGNCTIEGGSGGSVGGDVRLKAGTATTNGNILLQSLPTADPHVVDAVWNNAGVLTLSAG